MFSVYVLTSSQYFECFLVAAFSASLPASIAVSATYEAATVSTNNNILLIYNNNIIIIIVILLLLYIIIFLFLFFFFFFFFFCPEVLHSPRDLEIVIIM